MIVESMLLTREQPREIAHPEQPYEYSIYHIQFLTDFAETNLNINPLMYNVPKWSDTL